MIGNIDFKMTKQLQEREKRRQKQEEFLNVTKIPKLEENDNCGVNIEREETTKNIFGAENRDSIPTTTSSEPTTNFSSSQMCKNLPTLARECDRWGLSDRGAAAVSTALLQDLGIITEQETSSVIDRSKVRRERQKLRSQLHSTDTDKKYNLCCSQYILMEGRTQLGK